MDTVAIDLDRSEAKRLYHEYLTHRHFETPVDVEIRRAYREIAKGGVVIKALESIVNAGLGADQLPKLAIIRADMQHCNMRVDGTWVRMAANEGRLGWGRRMGPPAFQWPVEAFPGIKTVWKNHRAIVPMIPAKLRPKSALSNYHILFEAEWSEIVPKDPLLLRHLGKGDLWLVVAAWDLTEVERVALQARVAVN
jgi:hypothetical protein